MTTINGRQMFELAMAHVDADPWNSVTWGPLVRYVADEQLTTAHFDVLAARALPLAVLSCVLISGHRDGLFEPSYVYYPALVAAGLADPPEGDSQ